MKKLPADAGFQSLLITHEFELSDGQIALISSYLNLLGRWNRRVNLVSSTDLRVLGPLILEALWAATQYPEGFRSHLDIGSGAGFPALPLGILRPEVEVTLVESRIRKAVFLETVASELGLRNLRIVNQRFDHFLGRIELPGPWQCVSIKGLRFNRKGIHSLLRSTAEGVCLWVFHGRKLPLDIDPASCGLSLAGHKECPFHAGWYLSRFRKGSVSRETS